MHLDTDYDLIPTLPYMQGCILLPCLRACTHETAAEDPNWQSSALQMTSI